MILLTSEDYYTLKSPRTREHECVRQGKFACVPYINITGTEGVGQFLNPQNKLLGKCVLEENNIIKLSQK